MSSLFLLGATWAESPAGVQAARESRAGENPTILALDFWAGKKLREASLAYQTPREYLDVGRCHDLDALAAKLAQTWYEAIGQRLDYHGISLGEVAEYDFTALFIDALRSVEIARAVFGQRNPDRIYLTPQLPRIPSDRPNGICYESLPRVVENLASQRNVHVTSSGTPFVPASQKRGLSEVLRRRIRAARTRLRSRTTWGGGSALFMYVPSHERIGTAIPEADIRSISLRPAGRAEARGRTSEFGGLWEELEEDADFRAALTHDAVPLSDILAPRFRAFFTAGISDLVAYIRGAEWLIRRLRPRILVLAEDVSPISRATAQAFRREGVPILVVQHGTVSVDMGGYHVMPREGDRQAVWGEIPREWHLRRGKAADSQVVTGNPGFDSIATGYEPEEGDLLQKLQVKPDVGLILVVTEWFSGLTSAATIEDEERYIRYTLRALDGLPGHQTVVKLHPNFQDVYEGLVRAIAEEEGVEVTLAKANLWDLVALADLVIVSNSTVGLEAMVLGKPVVVVDTYEGVEMVPYVASGAALGASTPEEIASAATKALREEGVREEMERSRRKFVREYAHLQDGKASDRVGRLIGRMVHPSKDDA